MIVAVTRRRSNDTRIFCYEWYAIPSNKYNPNNLNITEYAYPDHDVPDDFYKKHVIYYVDTDNGNRLTKAYELEDQWETLSFLDTVDTVAKNGTISDNIYVQYLAKVVEDFGKRMDELNELLEVYNLAKMELRINKLEQNAVLHGDTVNINQESL